MCGTRPPTVDPQIEPSKWRLSREGRRLAGSLAPTLASVASVVSSRERKAIETAAIAAAGLDLTPEQHPGLNEHRRGPGDWRSRSDFEATMKQLFRRRSEVVFGRESADQAERRFRTAVFEVMERHAGNTAIVTHGTVMSLFVGRATSVDPWALWTRLGMPSSITMSWPQLELLDVIESYD